MLKLDPADAPQNAGLAIVTKNVNFFP